MPSSTMRSLVSLASLAAVSAADYNCNKGCSLGGTPVCSQDDGSVLVNECVAYCQNIAYEACDRLMKFQQNPKIAKESVTIDDMQRFSENHFNLVNKMDPADFASSPPKTDNEVLNPNDLIESPEGAGPDFNDGSWKAIIMTKDGFEYVANSLDYDFDAFTYDTAARSNDDMALTKMRHHVLRELAIGEDGLEDVVSDTYEALAATEATDATDAASTATEKQSSSTNKSRNMVVIGDDTRSLVSDTTSFPQRAIAEVDYHDRIEGGCTATLIGPNTALTAAHCVYDTNRQTWIGVRFIAPGRYRDDETGETIEPYGKFAISHMTTFEAWKTERDQRSDIAVLTLEPNVDDQGGLINPGDLVGYIGLERASLCQGSVRDATITGYPSDKPNGQMWASGRCPQDWWLPNYGLAFHYCDTKAGNSGSSVITPSLNAIGVHAYGYTDGNGAGVRNGAAMLYQEKYDAVLAWSGRSRTPNAVSGTGRMFGRICGGGGGSGSNKPASNNNNGGSSSSAGGSSSGGSADSGTSTVPTSC